MQELHLKSVIGSWALALAMARPSAEPCRASWDAILRLHNTLWVKHCFTRQSGLWLLRLRPHTLLAWDMSH